MMVYICTKFHENILDGMKVIERTILNYFMAYRVYLSDYLPLHIGTMAAYLSTGANQFALKILKLFIQSIITFLFRS